MKIFLHAFVNWGVNNWARLMFMVEYIYKNAQNANIGYISFELNCSYHSLIFSENDVNPCLISRSAHKMAKKLRELIFIYQQN